MDRILDTINRGIRKINVNTEVSIAAVTFLSDHLNIDSKNGDFPHFSTLNERVQEELAKVMENYIVLFSNESKSKSH
ncbi:hypothetical protein [Peribacillus sp. NPDC096540]|uniref:hypothetical protein n=1 Tax=Peribacillus sp. NPDC096540 TaxID=3390612 RepID=UPI003CFF1640